MAAIGKRVVISGGSSGIGLEAARQLVQEGHQVAILARNADRLAAAAAEISEGASGSAIGVPCDATDDASVEAAAAQVMEALGGVDLLVCNQGYARCAAVWDAPFEDYTSIMDTNYLGHVRLVKAFGPAMRDQGSGAILLVTSMLGFMSFYGYSAYAASKFAIVGFAEAIRQEFGHAGVSVHVFYPPTTDTPGLAAENETKPAVTWAIEGSSTEYAPSAVAKVMLDGVRKGRFVNMIGLEAWAIYTLNRWVPWLVRLVIDGQMRSHFRKAGTPS